MEKKIKVQVIFLESADALVSLKNKSGNISFISDREIQEGDWIYHTIFGIMKVNKIGRAGIMYCDDASMCWGKNDWKIDVFKVEVSTDKSLGLPLISDSFVKAFVKKNGDIREVNIELLTASRHESSENYEDDVIVLDNEVINTIDKDDLVDLNRYSIVKTRKDNTVITSKIEERLYNEQDMKNSHREGMNQGYLIGTDGNHLAKPFKDWLSEYNK